MSAIQGVWAAVVTPRRLGTQAKGGDRTQALRSFRAAIDIDPRTAPAYLELGDLHERQGNVAAAIESWESLIASLPDRAYLAFERLERAYRTAGSPERFVTLCEQLVAANAKDWRARLALARHVSDNGFHRRALELLLDALPHNPHGLAVHQEIWQTLSALELDATLVQRYVALAREAVFYLDPHVCTRCRYRSTELLWQCPQCHEWNTFIEERITPVTKRVAAVS